MIKWDMRGLKNKSIMKKVVWASVLIILILIILLLVKFYYVFSLLLGNEKWSI